MTHVTCRLTAKNGDQLREPYARSAVEYWLPFTVHRVSSHSASVLGGDDRGLKSWHGTQSEPIGRHAARLPAASAPVMVMTVEVPLAQSSW